MDNKYCCFRIKGGHSIFSRHHKKHLPNGKKCIFADSRYNDTFMEKMTLFHGSAKVIEEPVFGAGNPKNDYGLGFYCTKDLELAKEWACAELRGGFANKYLLETQGLETLRLNEKPYHILNWLAILLENRTFFTSSGLPTEARNYLLDNFLPAYKDYDLIIGYRADDSYFSFASAFLNNTISLEQLRRAMHLGLLGEQVVLKSAKSFESLHFEGFIPADGNVYFLKRQARDRQAREDYKKEKSAEKAADAVYMIDILRQKWNNDDPRL